MLQYMGFNTKKANESSNIEEVDEMNIDFGEEALAGVESTDEVEELKRKLYIDAVLGCQNRAKFEDDFKELNSEYTYFSIDGNALKYINDNFSHEAGDTLLKTIAECGMSVWGNSFYRFGGDEFGALISCKQSTETCDKQVKDFKRLLEEADKKFPEFPISASIGYAFGDADTPLKDVIDIADEMMYLDKAEYKKKYPQYDARRAQLTPEVLKDAIEDGTFREIIHKYREEKQAESGVSTSVEEVQEDFTFDGIREEDSQPLRQPKKSTEIVPVVQDDDLGTYDVSTAEQVYQDNELTEKIQPILHETTQKAVKEAVKYQNDKLKLEVSEVLQDEVGYRLSKYERRRRRRDLKEKLGFIIKGVVIFLVIIFILGNAQLRLRFALVTKDLGNMLSGLMKGEEVNSNQLVHDMFKDLGDELNEVNTIDKGFDIDKEGDLDE